MAAPAWRASSTLFAATITGTPPPRSWLRQIGVTRTQAGTGVHHEQRQVRALERHQRLAANLLGHLVLAREVNAAGVHEREADVVQSASISLRSRVTPASSCTTASRVPESRFTSVDLPTFG